MVYNLHTKKKLVRPYVVGAQMSKHIVDLVNKLGKDQGITNLIFQTKHKKLIWDSS